MPTLWSSNTFYQALFTQYHEYLVEILFRNILPSRNIRTFNWALPIISGHVEHSSQAVIPFHCKLHYREPFRTAYCYNPFFLVLGYISKEYMSMGQCSLLVFLHHHKENNVSSDHHQDRYVRGNAHGTQT